MKQIPMSPEARRLEAVRRRKVARAWRLAVTAMAIVTAAAWAYILLAEG